MKINYFWDKDYSLNEIGIQLNPQNQHLTTKLDLNLNGYPKLEVINPMNERKSTINYSEIYLIEAMDHLSKIYTIDEKIFYAKGRLKEFEALSINGIIRINNSVMLNLTEVAAFNNGQYARLEVHTKNGQTHIVSRHYAKQIKEEFQCLKN
ncbi:LytTR family transcriptional regulator [Enterococcus sp. BWT-B8]|uniref:LytTR family DNA-binding domain-containing protein n=1 Tax=unclassified Enterococcus TaxID=2608891 RepID=UPI001E3FD915|nr:MULTISPECIES: LytTR family DNA-binding domain-containing protein [unclassified Enterococcus]MCB5951458.1 LytTR family transcriptional regulator [Enterococcus sp. BWT-B8]MCB5955017.1 LytTR family transcriptional regulator [Enterococcus sp. CWB-B31]